MTFVKRESRMARTALVVVAVEVRVLHPKVQT
jgi:hypothetical protein